MYCIYYGRPFVETVREYARDAKAVIAWGSCASWGCVQAARPNPTGAVPIDKVRSTNTSSTRACTGSGA